MQRILTISLNTEYRQNLIITGKNGSGKTSLLLSLQKYLQSINDGQLLTLIDYYIPQLLERKKTLEEQETEAEKFAAGVEYQKKLQQVQKYKDGVDFIWNQFEDLEVLFLQGDFITAFFPADRKMNMLRAQGVEDVRLAYYYDVHSTASDYLLKYMVHLKTQQIYARNEGDKVTDNRIQKWFDRFVDALRVLLDDNTVMLEYSYREYDFKIHEQGRNL